MIYRLLIIISLTSCNTDLDNNNPISIEFHSYSKEKKKLICAKSHEEKLEHIKFLNGNNSDPDKQDFLDLDYIEYLCDNMVNKDKL